MRKNTMRFPVILIVVGLVLMIYALFQTKFDVSALAAAECEMKTQTVSQPFDRISANTADLNVILSLAPDGVCVVEYPEGETVHVTVKTENGALVVSQDAFAKFPFNILPIVPRFPKVEIRLPEREYASLAAKTGNGDVSVPSDFCFQSVEIRTKSGNLSFSASAEQTRLWATSGNISVCGGSVGAAEAESTSGNILFENVRAASLYSHSTSGKTLFSSVECGGALDASATSGTVELSGVTCGALSANTSSGRVRAENTVCASHLSAATTSGDIRLADCDAQTISVKSTSGDVDARILTPKRVRWKTASGSVSVPDDADGGQMNVTTTSGSIRVSFGQ